MWGFESPALTFVFGYQRMISYLLGCLLWIRLVNAIPAVKFFMYNISDFEYLGCKIHKLSSNKHAHFAIALKQFESHSWRVFDPAQADVFFVPFSLDWLGRSLCDKRYEARVEHVVENLKTFLENSSWFPTKRHFVIANDYKANSFIKVIRKTIPNLIVVNAEMSENANCTVALGYTTYEAVYKFHKFERGGRDRLIELSLHEMNVGNMSIFDTRNYSVSFLGQIDPRHPGYSDRNALFHDPTPFHRLHNVFITTSSKNTSQYNVPACVDGSHDRCAMSVEMHHTARIMMSSNFSLCFRGDTVGADRNQNSMVYGAIPISVASDAYEAYGWMPFQSVIPYKDMFVIIPRDIYLMAPVQAIENAIYEITSNITHMRHMQTLLQRYRPDYDWAAKNSRMSNNLLQEVKRCPCQYYNS